MLHLLSPRFGRLGVCSRIWWGVEGRIRDRFASVCIFCYSWGHDSCS